MRSLPVQPLDFEVLRFYLIMPFYHEFDNPKHQNQLQVPFAEAILNLRDTQAEVLGECRSEKLSSIFATIWIYNF